MAYLDCSEAWESAPPSPTASSYADGSHFSRLSTPLLPPVYARLPILTQLWLQSRLTRRAARELKRTLRQEREREIRRGFEIYSDEKGTMTGEDGRSPGKRLSPKTVLRLPRGPGAKPPDVGEIEKMMEVMERDESMRRGDVLALGEAQALVSAESVDTADPKAVDFMTDPREELDAEYADADEDGPDGAHALVLPSGRLDPSAFRDAGWARPATLSNVGLQLDICRLLWPKVWRALWAERRWSGNMLMYLFRVVYDGLSTTLNLWADQRMFDLVEQSFKTGVPATWHEALIAVGMALGVRAFSELVEWITSRATRQLESYVDFCMERAYLRAQLGMTLQARNSPLHTARVHEAGVFAGFEPQFGLERPISGPWMMVRTFGDAMSLVIRVGVQGAMLGRMLYSAFSGNPRYRWGNAALLTLSLAPAIIQIGLGRAYQWLATREEQEYVDPTPHRIEQATRSFATDSQYTLELVLFGLKDWVLAQWEKARQEINRRKQEYRSRTEGFILSTAELLRNGVQYGFFALVATQSVPTSFSLGALHAQTEMSQNLLNAVMELKDCFQGVAQIPYYLAAFVAATDDEERLGGQVDYERHRVPGGMRIEAKSLGFTYPGADKPTLHDINLSIEPGQTIAIVGSNGSGKTTLVKALLGLHGHTGSLEVNGTEIADYDHTTLHARMSCLFQDYCKYQMSLRVNVGLGDTKHIDDDKSVLRAIRRGGARPILAKVGLEGQLNPFQQPRDSGRRRPRTRRDSSAPAFMNGAESTETGTPMTPLTPAPATPAAATPGPADAADAAPLTQEGLDAVSAAVAEDPPSSGDEDEIMVREPVPGEVDVGTCISGGQWQRVALSRAFMRSESADLIVFDEPSASLDPKAESELFDRIHSLSKQNSTTIFISHRYATVKRADKIAFVDHGTIVEFGSHDELMAKRGKYWEMYTLQAEAWL